MRVQVSLSGNCSLPSKPAPVSDLSRVESRDTYLGIVTNYRIGTVVMWHCTTGWHSVQLLFLSLLRPVCRFLSELHAGPFFHDLSHSHTPWFPSFPHTSSPPPPAWASGHCSAIHLSGQRSLDEGWWHALLWSLYLSFQWKGFGITLIKRIDICYTAVSCSLLFIPPNLFLKVPIRHLQMDGQTPPSFAALSERIFSLLSLETDVIWVW